MPRKLLMTKYDSKTKLSSGGLWTPDEGFWGLWQGGKVDIEEGVDLKLAERITSASLGSDYLHIGLNTGVIRKINKNTGKIVASYNRWDVSEDHRLWDKYGSRQAYLEQQKLHQDLEARSSDPKIADILAEQRKRDGERFPSLFGLDAATRGIRSITGLVEFEGRVYDASSMGVFDTDAGRQVGSEWTSSLIIWDGKLCYVPVSRNILNKIETGERKIPNMGDLLSIDLNLLVPHLTPFDGSGYKQAEFSVVGDIAYVHHGDWPGERITQRNLRTGQQGPVVRIPTSYGFIPHQGKMFDLRNLHNNSWVTSSDEEDFKRKSIFGDKELCSGISKGSLSLGSAISGEELGILVTLYDLKSDSTEIMRVDTETKRTDHVSKEKGSAEFLMN